MRGVRTACFVQVVVLLAVDTHFVDIVLPFREFAAGEADRQEVADSSAGNAQQLHTRDLR